MLFAGAAKMGALLGGGTPEQVSALEQYGFNTGLAFQIVDDILDLIADSKQLGKTAGIDMVQGKGFATMMVGANGGKTTTATAVVDVDAGDPLACIRN